MNYREVKILGELYTVETGVPKDSDRDLEKVLGYCYPIAKKIVVADFRTVEQWSKEPADFIRKQERQTLRHEVIHAFLAESGLWGNSGTSSAWAMNEEMVDWIAMQWPKINDVYKELGCCK